MRCWIISIPHINYLPKSSLRVAARGTEVLKTISDLHVECRRSRHTFGIAIWVIKGYWYFQWTWLTSNERQGLSTVWVTPLARDKGTSTCPGRCCSVWSKAHFSWAGMSTFVFKFPYIPPSLDFWYVANIFRDGSTGSCSPETRPDANWGTQSFVPSTDLAQQLCDI